MSNLIRLCQITLTVIAVSNKEKHCLPCFFILFINDMSSYIQGTHADVVTLNELTIYLLLFAHDTVLFSYSVAGLQTLLNKLYDYCKCWTVTVNVNTTVAMMCKTGPKNENVDLFYNHEKHYQSQKALADQAWKATFSLKSLFERVSLKPSEKVKLFDCMIIPIMNYGSEIWGSHKAPDMDRIYMRFLKYVLNVRTQITNAAVFGELGRVSLDMLRKERILKYWYKLKSSQGSLINIIFRDQVENNIRNSWASYVQNLLNDLGFNFLWTSENVTKSQLAKVIERLQGYDSHQFSKTFHLQTHKRRSV